MIVQKLFEYDDLLLKKHFLLSSFKTVVMEIFIVFQIYIQDSLMKLKLKRIAFIDL